MGLRGYIYRQRNRRGVCPDSNLEALDDVMRVMMSIQTAELVLFDEKENELVMELFSTSQGKPCDFVIGVEENAHIFEFLEDLGELE